MIAEKTHFEVLAAGEVVVFKIGSNFARCIDFDLSIQIGHDLTSVSRSIKRICGDQRRTWRVAGALTDAAERSPPYTEPLPERLRVQDVRVYAEGKQVAFKIGKHTARFDYEAGLTIGQWFRVRGKEARNNANEKEHWTRFVKQ